MSSPDAPRRHRAPGTDHYHGEVRTIEEQLVPEGGPRRVAQRARTAAALPGRVVAVEDRCSALETHVAGKIDEMRSELAEIRMLLNAVLDTETDLAGLVGRLLADASGRIAALEEETAAQASGTP